jgi:hypothetical protein
MREWRNQSINQSVSQSIKSIYLWLYSPLLDLGRFFSFLILYTVGRTPSTGDQPVARPLPTHRTTQTQNKRTQTSMPWVGFEPTIPEFEWTKTVYGLDHAAIVISKSGSTDSYNFNLSSRWKWVASFTIRPYYSRGSNPRCPVDRRQGGPLWPHHGKEKSFALVRNRILFFRSSNPFSSHCTGWGIWGYQCARTHKVGEYITKVSDWQLFKNIFEKCCTCAAVKVYYCIFWVGRWLLLRDPKD